MFTADELHDLPAIISGPRFATYLRACCNNTASALRLYVWNADVSAAFIVPLHICEVAVRNGVVEAIERVHGPNWPWSNGFIRSLPAPKKPHHYNPQVNLRAVAAKQPTAGKVVAELNFAFWEKVFTVGQDQRLWAPHMHAAFPGLSPPSQHPQQGRRRFVCSRTFGISATGSHTTNRSSGGNSRMTIRTYGF